MKKKIAITGVLAMTAPVLWAAGAVAQTSGPTPGFYIGAEGGWTHLNDMPADGLRLRNDDGFAAGINGGYAFGNGLRLEGEIPYRYNNADSVHLGGASAGASGHISSQAVMANVLYDFHIFPYLPLTPYIGGGVGAARIGINHLSTGGGLLINDHDYEFAYQAIGGVQYALTPQWSVSLDYRYFATRNPSFNLAGGGSSRTSYQTHNIMLGIAYHFGAPTPPPPLAEAPPPPVQQQAAAPVPPPPPQAQTFLVFFAFDKSDLSDAARQVVANAAQFAKANGKTTIDVTGYTDSSGKPDYNRRLSQRRADAVAAYIETLGITKSEIGLAARGEEDQRVPTPPNTREPQNRRVEIVTP
jgi:OmpA-OmpF porin, OOP family